MSVVLGVCGTAPILRRRTARMFKPATHRARECDRHAAITGPVKCRRLARQRPCKRSRSNDTNDNAGHYQRGAAFARRERITRWSLAFVDRRSPLHPANSIRPQYMHLPRLRIPCDHWSASRGTHLGPSPHNAKACSRFYCRRWRRWAVSTRRDWSTRCATPPRMELAVTARKFAAVTVGNRTDFFLRACRILLCVRVIHEDLCLGERVSV
jgi:hypothetical protein